MSEFVVMEELDGITQLVGNVSDLIEGVRTVVVVLLYREGKRHHLKYSEVMRELQGLLLLLLFVSCPYFPL